MLELREQHGGSVILLMEVPPQQTNLYGCAAVQTTTHRTWSASPTSSRNGSGKCAEQPRDHRSLRL